MCADSLQHDPKKPALQPNAPAFQEEIESPSSTLSEVDSILNLQRMIGNQGVQRLIANGHIQPRRLPPLPNLPGVTQPRSTMPARPATEEKQEQDDTYEEAPLSIIGVESTSASKPGDKGKFQILTGAPDRPLQRETKGAVGVGLSTTGAKIAPEVTISTKKPFEYVELELEGGVAGEVEITWSEDTASIGVEGKAGKGSKEGAIKAKIPVYKKALEDKAKAESDQSIWEKLDVESVDVEMEFPKIGSDDEKTDTTMGVYLVIKTKGGHEFKPFVNLFNAETKKGETEISGPSAGLEVAIELLADQWRLPVEGFVSIAGKLQVKGKVAIKPNYTKIAQMALKRYGAAFSRAAIRSIVTRLATNPFVLGGALTIAASWAAMNDIYDIKETARKAAQASLGYRVGFMSGIGLKSQFSGGDADWTTHGSNVGTSALGNLVTQILAEPAMAAFEFTHEEIAGAIREGVEARKQDFESALYKRADPMIKAAFVKQWREMKRNSWYGMYPEAYVKRDEKYLRTRMGLPDYGDLDESFLTP